MKHMHIIIITFIMINSQSHSYLVPASFFEETEKSVNTQKNSYITSDLKYECNH